MASEGKVKKPIYKKWWFWLIIILIIGGIGAGASDNSQPTSSTPTSNTLSTTETKPIEYKKASVDELDSALEKNAAAAKDTYNGQYLEITGRLGTIDSDLKYISLLSTTNQFDIVGIQCYIKNNEQKEIVKTLSKDDTIVIKGKITNVGEVLGYSLDIIEITK